MFQTFKDINKAGSLSESMQNNKFKGEQQQKNENFLNT